MRERLRFGCISCPMPKFLGRLSIKGFYIEVSHSLSICDYFIILR